MFKMIKEIMGIKSKKEIIILSRENITNYGDPIIGDCCKYLLEKSILRERKDVEIKIIDIYKYKKYKKTIKEADIIVIPGGGINGIKFNRIIQQILRLVERNKKTKVYYNAVGILKSEEREENIKLLKEIINHEKIEQITTRGDYEKLKTYIKREFKYPARLVLDPAMWVNEVYGIEKKESEKVGIGVIRAEIFETNGNKFSREEVKKMYIGIVKELEKRNIRWGIFTNGYEGDYEFGEELQKELLRNPECKEIKHPKNREELVEIISGYKSIIASRLHANIIATSLNIPTVGLVWNDKMNCFARMIKCEDRYIQVEKLKETDYIVDKMEEAIKTGYNIEAINEKKEETIETIRNIVEGIKEG